jgi:hypothetical protein
VDPTAGLDATEKRKFFTLRGLNSDSSIVSRLTSRYTDRATQKTAESSLDFAPDVMIIQSRLTNSVAFSPRANYTDRASATCWRNLVPTFVDRGVSRGQRDASPKALNLSFLDRSRYFFLFK